MWFGSSSNGHLVRQLWGPYWSQAPSGGQQVRMRCNRWQLQYTAMHSLTPSNTPPLAHPNSEGGMISGGHVTVSDIRSQ